MAPLIRVMLQNAPPFKVITGLTGQHPNWAGEVLKEFGISPDLMGELPASASNDLTALQSSLLKVIKKWLNEETPDLVLVQGDTSSALAGALAAFQSRIPVGHIEAGLRSGDTSNPFPEEIHRRIISRISDLHFAPTLAAQENLIAEGVAKEKILHSGNTGIDAQRLAKSQPGAELPEHIRHELSKLSAYSGKLITVTLHRRENWPLVGDISKKLLQFIHSGPHRLIWVAHPNPALSEEVNALLKSSEQCKVLPPQGYFDFQHLLAKSDLLVTDSGGIQEESVGYGKPVVVLRRNTERVELCLTGNALICDPSVDNIQAAISGALDKTWQENSINPFGDGFAAERILEFLLRRFPWK